MFVYLMAWDAAGPVKIGISRDPEYRQASLQCSLPFPCYMLFWVDCGGEARAVETMAHRSLSAHRLHGEWFDVSIKRAIKDLRAASGQTGVESEWLSMLAERGSFFGAIRAKTKAASDKWATEKRTRDRLRQRRHRAALKEMAATI